MTLSFLRESEPTSEVQQEIDAIVANERGYLWRLLNTATVNGPALGFTLAEAERCRELIRKMRDMTANELVDAVQALGIRVKEHPRLVTYERVVFFKMHRAYKLLHPQD